MSEPDAAPELAALEEQLRLLAPRESGFDRDVLLYRAGRASTRGGWGWPLATALSTLVGVFFAGVVLLRPARVVERVVYLPAETIAEPSSPRITETPPAREQVAFEGLSLYKGLVEHLARRGLDGLPSPSPTTNSHPSPTTYSHYSQLIRGETLP